jgi:glycerol-3-phosphate dehydrogenase
VTDQSRVVAQVLRAYPFLEAGLARRLVVAYGTRALRLLGGARSADDLGRVFGADLTEAEVLYLMREEWARTAADVLWRRSKLGLRFSGDEIQALDAYMHAAGNGRSAAAMLRSAAR